MFHLETNLKIFKNSWINMVWIKYKCNLQNNLLKLWELIKPVKVKKSINYENDQGATDEVYILCTQET